MSARDYVHNVSPDHGKTEKDHFYPTPPEATKSLLALEPFDQWIWEPACGDGAISKVLIDAGHNVVSSDLVDRGYGTPNVDFLMESDPLAPQIITNPPFKLADQFVRHALSFPSIDKVALLLRLAWLEGVTRKPLFESDPPLARVWVSSRRLTMKRGGTDGGDGGGGMVAFAWFVWDRRVNRRPTTIQFFDWMDHAPECAKGRAEAPASAEPMPLFS